MSVREWKVLGKKVKWKKSRWKVILGENDFCRFKEECLIDVRTKNLGAGKHGK